MPGRDGVTRAIEGVVRMDDAPALRVLDPSGLDDSKDPDAFVRKHGTDKFRALVRESDCAVSWCARELIRGITPTSDSRDRRAALGLAGEWLGKLPARYALEQEDAVRHVADQCGYSRMAVERAFRSRFWHNPSRELRRQASHRVLER
jgi:hypothetical protein